MRKNSFERFLSKRTEAAGKRKTAGTTTAAVAAAAAAALAKPAALRP